MLLDVDPDTGEVVQEQQAQLQQAALDVQAGTLEDLGVLDASTITQDPGAIRCACGRVLELTADWVGTLCVHCGNEYGSGGEVFRANWREVCRETGELED